MAILNPTKIATLDNTPTFGHFADGLGLYFIRSKLLGIPLHGHGRRRQMTWEQLTNARAESVIKKKVLIATSDQHSGSKQVAMAR